MFQSFLVIIYFNSVPTICKSGNIQTYTDSFVYLANNSSIIYQLKDSFHLYLVPCGLMNCMRGLDLSFLSLFFIFGQEGIEVSVNSRSSMFSQVLCYVMEFVIVLWCFYFTILDSCRKWYMLTINRKETFWHLGPSALLSCFFISSIGDTIIKSEIECLSITFIQSHCIERRF